VNIGIFGQNNQKCIINPPPQPKIVVGYYPAYKYNSPDFNIINPSITHLNYIAFNLTDFTTNNRPYNMFNNSVDKFNKLRDYKNQNQNLSGIKLILSVLLPINDDLMKIPPFYNVQNGLYDPNNQTLQQFVGDLVAIANDFSFDGIDIDYPNKMPCYQPTQFNINTLNSVFSKFLIDLSNKLKVSNSNKILTITTDKYNIPNINPDIITFVNILAFRLNINTTHASAGISDIQGIINSWSSYVNNSKLVLGIELGGIIEAISPKNPNFNDADIANQNFTILNQKITFPSSLLIDENITDPCKVTSYAHLQWKNLTSLLAPPCYSNPIQGSGWNYSFDNKSQQSYFFQRIQTPILLNLQNYYYYISYEDYQSLNAKFDLIKKNNLAGIAIPDITKDYSQLMNFISTGSPPGNPTQPKSTSTSSPEQSTTSNNTGVIVGGVLGAVIFVGAIAAIARPTSEYNTWTPDEDETLRMTTYKYGVGKWTQVQERWKVLSKTKFGRWNPEEDNKLQDLAKQYKEDYREILKRPVHSVYVRLQTPKWTIEELDKLRDLLKEYVADTLVCVNPFINKRMWGKTEKELIKKGVEMHGNNWVKVSQVVGTRYWQIEQGKEKSEKITNDN
ncbi:18375_t:CDS:2, partial [Gigaspora margarita]